MPFVLSAGSLDRRISIEARSETRDAFGGVVVSWSALAGPGLPARRLDVTASERFEAGTDLAKRQAKFLIRWIDGLDATMRIVESDDEGGQVWRIVGPPVEMGRRVALEILAEAVEEAE